MPKIFRFSARPVLSGALLAASLALPVGAASVPFEDSAWKVQRFSLFSGNDYGFEGDSLSVASDGTVSIAYRPLAPANWGRAPPLGPGRWMRACPQRI